jgi:uncharacterized damage-inducible protein DinB
MNFSEMLVGELMQEAAGTRAVLERVPEEKYSWKPHPKAQSAGQLAHHIAGLPLGITEIAKVGSVPYGFQPPRPEATSRAELLKYFDDSLAQGKANLAAMDAAAMETPWSVLRDGQPVLTIPRYAFLRTILFNHLYHHRGQLTTYLRAMDVKVPSIYGPSADEMPPM